MQVLSKLLIKKRKLKTRSRVENIDFAMIKIKTRAALKNKRRKQRKNALK